MSKKTLLAVCILPLFLLDCTTTQTAPAFNDILKYSFRVVIYNNSAKLENFIISTPLQGRGHILKIDATHDYTIDKENNLEIIIGDIGPYQIISARVDFTVCVSKNPPYCFDTYKKEAMPQSIVEKYTEPVENLWESDQLVGLAENIIKGSLSEGAIPIKIMDWVRSHMQYKPSENVFSALWALRSKEGDCVEFSNLFIALMRAAGFPARGAIVCPPGAVAMTHMVAEVYHPLLGWVFFDPVSGYYGDNVPPFVYITPVENLDAFSIVRVSYKAEENAKPMKVSVFTSADTVLDVSSTIIVKKYSTDDAILKLEVEANNNSPYDADLLKILLNLNENVFLAPEPVIERYVKKGSKLVVPIDIQMIRKPSRFEPIVVNIAWLYSVGGLAVEKTETKTLYLYPQEQPHHVFWIQAILISCAVTIFVVLVVTKLAKKPEKKAIPVSKHPGELFSRFPCLFLFGRSHHK